MDYSCSKPQQIIHLMLNEIKYCCLVSAAKHLPTGHCLRPTAVPDLHDVCVREDGLGQRVSDTIELARVYFIPNRTEHPAVGTFK